jgi:threonine dehydrogenase-like Zn-dependent dehydrogenase
MAGITVDAVGHSGVVVDAAKATANHGQVVLLGTPREPHLADVTELLAEVHRRWVTLRGALEWCLGTYPSGRSGNFTMLEKQQIIFDWIRRGELKLEPLISHRMLYARVKDAYEGLLTKPEEYTGVVLTW